MILSFVTYLQKPLDLKLRPSWEEEKFVQGPCNQEAYDWVQSWPQWPLPFAALIGPEKSGKTFLGCLWQKRAQALRVGGGVLPSPDIVLEQKKEQGYGALWIDDAETLVEKDASRQWLFHTYNLLKEEKGFLLMTASASPATWNCPLPDLSSRLKTFYVCAIQEPDTETLEKLLDKFLRDRGLKLPLPLLSYLLNRIERSYEAIYCFAAALDSFCLSRQKSLSLKVLREFFTRG